MPVRGHVGSDYERLRPEFRVIPNPWAPPERVMLVPPIAPDVALIHAIAATGDGTLLLDHMEDVALLAWARSASSSIWSSSSVPSPVAAIAWISATSGAIGGTSMTRSGGAHGFGMTRNSGRSRS